MADLRGQAGGDPAQGCAARADGRACSWLTRLQPAMTCSRAGPPLCGSAGLSGGSGYHAFLAQFFTRPQPVATLSIPAQTPQQERGGPGAQACNRLMSRMAAWPAGLS
jgi:hypothetical protein